MRSFRVPLRQSATDFSAVLPPLAAFLASSSAFTFSAYSMSRSDGVMSSESSVVPGFLDIPVSPGFPDIPGFPVFFIFSTTGSTTSNISLGMSS